MKRAIVVGASSGIGREVARLLLAEGWHVGVAARRTILLEELKSEFPERVITSCIDVTEDMAVQKLHDLIGQLGGVGLFFYASGIGKQNMQLDTDTEERTVMTNSLGFVRMIDTVYNYMSVHQGGHIAVITSIAGTKGLGAAPSYSATKALQSTYIEALEQQARLRRLNIRFTDLRPGFVDTELLGKDKKYPMLMRTEVVARQIVNAINSRKSVCVIDWRYRVLTFFWHLIPRYLWVRLKISNSA
ncbi:MAG: SDR family NAD(P)-dependent oxidoreductase [Porphyromonadaceae bacterium]